jgi:hypothetical protein
MANAEKMRAVIAKIKEDLSQWNQRYFCNRNIDCGTQYCFAGRAIALDGWYPMVVDHGFVAWTKPGFNVRCSSESLAQEILELTDDEVDELFYTMSSSIDRYEKLVEDVITRSLEDA